MKAGLRISLPALLSVPVGWAEAASPMGYLWTHGPAADPVTRLSWGLIVISLAVVAIVIGLVLYACLRRRPPVGEQHGEQLPRVPVERDTGGMSWVYIGTGISTIVLFGSTIWTIRVLSAVAAPDDPALTVDVIAHQWWWEVRYPGDDVSQTVVTANEIHIPVGEPVLFRLRSDDVIHSFWVPKLSGKSDVIPGQTNYNWVQADQAGEYRGQCAEFCGIQHARMAFSLIAQERADFDTWRESQGRDSPSLVAQPEQPQQPQQQPQRTHGREVFLAHCARCHTVRGTPAHGRTGPDLTHLMSRRTIAAGMLPNTTASLHGWVANAQAIKPGARMPGFYLSPQELHAVVDYLETLQ